MALCQMTCGEVTRGCVLTTASLAAITVYLRVLLLVSLCRRRHRTLPRRSESWRRRLDAAPRL
jgi:hypothetical protein